jgi:hypothetical protein
MGITIEEENKALEREVLALYNILMTRAPQIDPTDQDIGRLKQSFGGARGYVGALRICLPEIPAPNPMRYAIERFLKDYSLKIANLDGAIEDLIG